MLRRLLLSLLVTACAAVAMAQTDARFTQYYEVPAYYNPAATGRSDNIRIRAGARLQWLGVERAPLTFTALADMRWKVLGKYLGVGVVLQQESAGLYDNITAGVQLGYKLQWLGGEWTFALQPGLINERFRGSEVFIPDDDDYHQSTDEAIPTNDVGGTAFDLGAGLWYRHKYLQAGVSILHALSPTIKFSADTQNGESAGVAEGEKQFQFQARRTLYFIAEGNIPIKNTLLEVMPSVMVASDLADLGAHATLRMRYNKMLSAGVGYRYNDAVTASVAVEFKNFFLGYSFDYSLSAIGRASSGSHELFAGYSLKLDLRDKNRNRHKSIRIM